MESEDGSDEFEAELNRQVAKSAKQAVEELNRRGAVSAEKAVEELNRQVAKSAKKKNDQIFLRLLCAHCASAVQLFYRLLGALGDLAVQLGFKASPGPGRQPASASAATRANNSPSPLVSTVAPSRGARYRGPVRVGFPRLSPRTHARVSTESGLITMAKQPFGVWGIDIGQCAIKALRLELIDGKPTATAFDYIEHPKILSQPDADPESLIRESLEKFLSRNEIGKDHVAIGIAGQSGALMRFVKLPPVEEKKVPDIVKFEARQQIPFPLDEVVWDYQKIGGGDTVGGFAMETEIGLFAMKRDLIAKALGYYQGTRTEVHIVQMTPLALVNYATYEVLGKGGPDEVAPDAAAESDTPRNKKRCAVALDVGTDTSNLIITDGAKIIWQRTVNIGGGHFTKALTKELKLTFAKAEHLKRNAAKSPELATILRALRPVLTEFVQEVQRSLGFFTNTHRDAHIAYMVGLGSAFKLPGLQKYLSEKLAVEVRKPNKVERLDGETVLADPVFAENVLTFPVAYGLALQGLELSRLRTNLLPAEVRVDRQIRAKKPAVAMAAAALLFGTGMLAVGYGSQLSSVQDERIAKGIEEAKSAKTLSTSQDTEFNSAKQTVDSGLTAVKAIVVGNDERLNWIRLQEVLAACLPRPPLIDFKTHDWVNVNDTNLNEKTPYDQTQFWQGVNQKRAIEKYQKRLAEGLPAEEILQDDRSEFLPIVNIESVYCRYVDSLPAFFAATDAYVQNTFVVAMAETMRESEREADTEKNGRFKPKIAEGGGWVFELRGYTYNQDAPNFIPRALLRNLKRANELAPKAGQKIQAVIPDGIDPVLGGPGVGETTTSDPAAAATPAAATPAGELLSHPFLLFVQPNSSPDPKSFRYIGTSMIDARVSGATAGPGGLGGPGSISGSGGVPGGSEGEGTGGAAAAAGASGPAWVPAGAASTTGGFGSGGSRSGLGGEGGLPGAPSMGGGGQIGGLSPPTGGSGTAAVAGALAPKTRYEFVVGFVWREPTPTDPTPERVAPTVAGAGLGSSGDLGGN